MQTTDEESEAPTATSTERRSFRNSYQTFVHKIRRKPKRAVQSISAQPSAITQISDITTGTDLSGFATDGPTDISGTITMQPSIDVPPSIMAGSSIMDPGSIIAPSGMQAPISEISRSSYFPSEIVPPSITTGLTALYGQPPRAVDTSTGSVENVLPPQMKRRKKTLPSIISDLVTPDEDPGVLEQKLRQKGLGTLKQRNIFIYKIYSVIACMQLLSVMWMNFFITNAETVKRDEVISIFFLTLIYALILELSYYCFNKTFYDDLYKWIYLFGCIMIGAYIIPFICLFYVLPGKHDHENQLYYDAELWIIVLIKCEFFAFLASVFICFLGLQNTFELTERRTFFIIIGALLGIPVLLEIMYIIISGVIWSSLDKSLIAFERIFPRWFILTWITYGIIVFAFYDIRRMVLGNRHRRLTSENSITAVILLYMDVINMPASLIPPLEKGRVGKQVPRPLRL